MVKKINISPVSSSEILTQLRRSLGVLTVSMPHYEYLRMTGRTSGLYKNHGSSFSLFVAMLLIEGVVEPV